MTIPAEVFPDNVNSPEHYRQGEVECIDAIKAQLTPEEYRGYLKGNIAKYVWRERHKGGTESLRKARWYMERLIEADTKTGLAALCDRLKACETRQKGWPCMDEAQEQLNAKAALLDTQEQEDGWIDWKGGECPVDPHRRVDIRWRVGIVSPGCSANKLDWSHKGLSTDIMAYHISKETTC